ncbi:MAG: hypothetical protein ACRDRX_14645 [Pseudonocardiaceae bacterium]
MVCALESALLDPASAIAMPVALPHLQRDVLAARSIFQQGVAAH